MKALPHEGLTMNRIALATVFFLCAVTGHAAPIVWTNVLGGNWNVTTNWSPNQVPGSSDTALITNDGSYTVSMNITTLTVSNLLVGGGSGTQTVSKTSGTLTVSDASAVGLRGILNLGGTLTTPNGLTIRGILNWSAGSIISGSVVVVETNAVINVSGSSTRTLSGLLTNSGTINWIDPSTTTSIGAAGVLYNLAGGLLDTRTNFVETGSGLLINDGTFRRSFTIGPFSVSATVVNNGVIDAQSGPMSFMTLSMGDGSSYVGTPLISFMIGTLNGSITAQNLVFAGSSLAGNGILQGLLTWSNAFNSTILAGASLTVATNSTFRVISGQTKTVAGVLTNYGTIICSNGYFGFSGVGAAYNQVGALFDVPGDYAFPSSAGSIGLVNDGVIRKSAGGGTATMNLPLVNRGIIEAASGTMNLKGIIAFEDGSSFVGAGTNVTSNANVTLSGSINSENLLFSDSTTLFGTGVIHGPVACRQVTIGSGAIVTLASDAVLNVNNLASAMFIYGSLTNAGTINWIGPSLLQFSGGTLHNLSEGVFDLKTNAGISSTGRFINEGTFRRSAGGKTNTVAAGVAFTNHGTINVQTGAVLFDGSLSNPDGTLAVSGGKISSTAPLTLTNGIITGSGTVEAPSITSAARVSPGASNAVLMISGNYTQQLAGSMEFDIGGTEPGVNQSQLIVTGNADLHGTVGLKFSPGYSPATGSSNIVLTAASLTGDFDCFNGFLLLGENKRLVRSVSSTNVVLTAISAPDPTQPTLNIAKSDQVLVCWPSEFVDYSLRSNTDLGTTSWTVVPGVTNRFLENPTAEAKFFDLLKQP
jgi:hypothetical protein